jgi:hypothetical protein
VKEVAHIVGALTLMFAMVMANINMLIAESYSALQQALTLKTLSYH